MEENTVNRFQKYYVLSIFLWNFADKRRINLVEPYLRELKDFSRKCAEFWLELKAELKGISSPLKKVCPTEPIKLAAKTQNKFSLTSTFTLLPSKFIAKSITWTEKLPQTKTHFADRHTGWRNRGHTVILYQAPRGLIYFKHVWGALGRWFPYNGLYGEAPPNGDTSLSLQV